jgi:hypothetical protein
VTVDDGENVISQKRLPSSNVVTNRTSGPSTSPANGTIGERDGTRQCANHLVLATQPLSLDS